MKWPQRRRTVYPALLPADSTAPTSLQELDWKVDRLSRRGRFEAPLEKEPTPGLKVLIGELVVSPPPLSCWTWCIEISFSILILCHLVKCNWASYSEFEY
eukprot:sb/3478676/